MGKLRTIRDGKAKAASPAPAPPMAQPLAEPAARAAPPHAEPAGTAREGAVAGNPPAPPSLPASVEASRPHVIDARALQGLPEEAFLNYSRTRFLAHGLSTMSQVLLAAVDITEINEIVRVAKQREVLPALFGQPPRASGPGNTVEAPPQSVNVTAAFEATVASPFPGGNDGGLPAGPTMNVRPGHAPGSKPPPPKTSRPPPPPVRSRPPQAPPRRSDAMPPPTMHTEGAPVSDISDMIIQIRNSTESTQARHDEANRFLAMKIAQLVKEHGRDRVTAAQTSASQKQQAGALPEMFTPLEMTMLELLELNGIKNWLARRLKDEEGVHRVLGGNGRVKAVTPDAAGSPAVATVGINAAAGPAVNSIPGPAGNAPAPIAAAAPAQADMPPFAGGAGEAKKSARQPCPGPVRRFFSGYTGFAIAGIGAHAGAVAYKDGFRSMADGAERVAEILSGRDIPHISEAWAAGVYAGAMTLALAVSLAIKRSIENRNTEKAFRRAQRSETERAGMAYAFSKLSAIVQMGKGVEDLKSQIRLALRTDEKLFMWMYRLRRDPVFDDILNDARVPGRLRGIISQVIIPGVELELMSVRLRNLADLIDSPSRPASFERILKGDEVFRTLCDDIFRRGAGDEYVDMPRARAVFAGVENSRRENVAEPLLRAVAADYEALRSKRQGVGME